MPPKRVAIPILFAVVWIVVRAGLSIDGARAPTPRIEWVEVGRLLVEDGDTLLLKDGHRTEEIRLLGIDCPETRRVEHDLPFDQPGGREALAFVEALLREGRIAEIRRAAMNDTFGRTLAYVLVDDRDLSISLLEAGHAIETVSRYGDNGLAHEAARCLAAAARAPPVSFEDPRAFRRAQRALAKRLKATGLWPPPPPPSSQPP